MPKEKPDRTLFTIGYEGRTVEGFLAVLVAHRIDLVIDVRELPLSRKRGFSKTSLRDALADQGINYLHVREAGNPFRAEAKTDPKASLRQFKMHIRSAPETVERLRDAAVGHRAVMLCFEADPGRCHRSILADEVARTDRALTVRSL